MSESVHDPEFLVKRMMGAKVEVLVSGSGKVEVLVSGRDANSQSEEVH